MLPRQTMANDNALATLLLSPSNQHVPEELLGKLTSACEKILDRLAPQLQRDLLSVLQRNPLARPQFAKLITLSDYAVEVICRLPEAFLLQINNGEFWQQRSLSEYQCKLQSRFVHKEPNALEAACVARELRLYRAEEMLRLIWRDQNRLATLKNLTHELSFLAEACLQCAVDFHYQLLCNEWGMPCDGDGQPIRLTIIGMGKLGAYELNLSSDIDLIFSYRAAGQLPTVDSHKSHQEFFVTLAQRLIKTIDEQTEDGFVFRVDMRLRPYGDSGALVHSYSALEDYYQTQGRDWERYAMIKGRVVVGDADDSKALMRLLKPFVYRRYIDFSVFDSLRSMKEMIVGEVRRKGLHDDIKLGAGGIREVEFIAQVFQLVHGGRDRNLQQRELVAVYDNLAQRAMLPREIVGELLDSYEFLRNTEHALQAQRDQQTQRLPSNNIDQLRIAWAMGFERWADFSEALSRHRENVRLHFSAVMGGDTNAQSSTVLSESEWAHLIEDDARAERSSVRSLCAKFKFGSKVASLQPVARSRLDKVMPLLMAQLQEYTAPVDATRRCLQIIDAILRRSAYLALLVENPLTLKHLVQLCTNSAYVTRKLVQHPILLDELIDQRTLYKAPDLEELRSSLRQQLLRIDISDTEAQMEQLRYFKRSQSLRVAAAELAGELPLMKVSDYLTFIAESLLEYVLDLAWHDVTTKYGEPQGASAQAKQFVVLAYGKLGGLELSHGSDLDLVFVYQAASDAMTTGHLSVDSATFYTRLGQRIIHLLSTRTAMGQVYEIDMRLRPSGNSGLLVSSTNGFMQYQNTAAWTWEHQALVRARAVAGDAVLMDWFQSVRQQLLTQTRNAAQLRVRVTEMRDKMREQPTLAMSQQSFHLKHSPGGIVDIEFMVQYGVLAHAAAEARLCEFTDNIRILEALEQCAFLPAEYAQQLRNAYVAYRAKLHQLSLQDQEPVVDRELFNTEVQAVTAVWTLLFEE